jgi:hypothetical protein
VGRTLQEMYVNFAYQYLYPTFAFILMQTLEFDNGDIAYEIKSGVEKL